MMKKMTSKRSVTQKEERGRNREIDRNIFINFTEGHRHKASDIRNSLIGDMNHRQFMIGMETRNMMIIGFFHDSATTT
jgi:hypothetical protein